MDAVRVIRKYVAAQSKRDALVAARFEDAVDMDGSSLAAWISQAQQQTLALGVARVAARLDVALAEIEERVAGLAYVEEPFTRPFEDPAALSILWIVQAAQATSWNGALWAVQMD